MIRAGVTQEWGRLRTVVVGRAWYRLPEPMPEHRRHMIPEALWWKAKRYEGLPMEEAMPSAWRRMRRQLDAVVRRLRARGIHVHSMPAFRPEEESYLAEGFRESQLLFPRDLGLIAGSRVIELSPRDQIGRAHV